MARNGGVGQWVKRNNKALACPHQKPALPTPKVPTRLIQIVSFIWASENAALLGRGGSFPALPDLRDSSADSSRASLAVSAAVPSSWQANRAQSDVTTGIWR